MPGVAPTVQCRSTAPVTRRPNLSTWSATMSTQAHPTDAPATLSRIAAFILVVGLSVLAVAAQLHLPSGAMQVPLTDDVAQFGD